MIGKILFPIIATFLPLGVYNAAGFLLDGESNILVMAVSGIFSCIFLAIIQYLLNELDRRFNRMNKYCGQWVEEMIHNDNGSIGKYIGIGTIQYDRTTGGHVFSGQTYGLDGEEKYEWSTDYFHSNRDNSMQYICSVEIPGQRSIGQITFQNPKECTGNIWVMDGTWYRFEAHRITQEELYRYNLNPGRKLMRKVRISNQDCSEFVRKYSEDRFY